MAKLFLVLFASALLVQSTVADCGCGQRSRWNAGNAAMNFGRGGYRRPTFAAPSVYNGPAALRGAPFSCAVACDKYPKGIAVDSKNFIDGYLTAEGQLPVMATVELKGDVPSNGKVGTDFRCGDGEVGISTDSLKNYGISMARDAPKQTARKQPDCGCYKSSS